MPETVTHPAVTAWPSLHPCDLRVEGRRQPLGVDERHPQLSWVAEGGGTDRAQSGYRVRVVSGGSDGRDDPRDERVPASWDSGEVSSARGYGVEYAGPELVAGTRYSWAVRIRDESGTWSPWSDPAWFETAGIEWAAGWIGSPDETAAPRLPALDTFAGGPEVQWIWPASPAAGPPKGEVTFAADLHLPAGAVIVSATAVVIGPGPVTLTVNGVEVPVAAGGIAGEALLAALTEGPNAVLVGARREPGTAPGLIARVDVGLAEGASVGSRTVSLATDGRWRCRAGGEERWALAEALGAHGDPPWGRQPATYRPSPYLRREFVLDQPIRRARVRATALGVYELRLNGRRLGPHRLSPGWTDFARRVPYQTYDVTDGLRVGANVLGAVLGDGWYAGHLAHVGPFQYGERRLLWAQLEVEFEDGTRLRLRSDDAWRTGTGRTRYADLQNGEVDDATAEPLGWDEAGFDDSGWPAAVVASPEHGRLEAEVAPPIVVAEELPAVRVLRRADGAQVIDFGQNLVGWVRLRLRGPRGSRVLVRHAEMLDHTVAGGPRLHTESLRHARCTDEFVLAGSPDGSPDDEPDGELAEPRFTVHGFRYCEVVGYEPLLDVTDAVACVAHADLEPTGTFACSEERLNRLHENIAWSQRGNFLAVPTDCPQRDERMGWTGDAQVFAATAAFGFDVRSFLRKWLRDVRDAQFASGSITHVAPDLFTKSGASEADSGGAAGWGDVITVLPDVLARVYGDRRTVEENLEAIEGWLAYCESTTTDFVRPPEGFGDWLAVTDTPRDLIATAFLAHSAELGAGLAARVGRADLVERWSRLHAAVRRAFRARWVRGGGVVVPDTQTAYALALRFGLFDDDEVPAAAGRLAAEIRARRTHLTTGFLGTPHLLPALSEHGYADVAFDLLVQESYPSWLYQVVHGDATTIWERWDSWSDSRGFQDPSMTSFNHYAYGAVGDWMYRTLGGIEIGPAGPHELLVRPVPGGGVTWAEASLRTVLGEVRTRWEARAGTFTLDLTVPVGARASVRLPGDTTDTVVGSGTHQFRRPL